MLKAIQSRLLYLQSILLQIDYSKRKRVALLAITFFFIIASYSILRPLKSSIFLGLVGKEYKPYSRLLTIILLIPCMLIHSKVVDHFKKHQTVYFFLSIYIVLTLIFAGLLAHPVYGLNNTAPSPFRIIGWAFDVFMDMYQALIVSTFWGFINYVSTPSFAKKSYGNIIAFSRIGGIISPAISFFIVNHLSLPCSTSIPLLISIAGFFLICAIFCVYLFSKFIPENHQTGYSTQQVTSKKREKPGILEGLKLMITQPYVLGIFALVYSFEIVNSVFDYQMHVLMSLENNNNIQDMSSFMFIYTATFQTLSLLFALFGTGKLLNRIGMRQCLAIMPLSVVILTVILVASPHLWTIFGIMVIMRGLNYGFNHPIREMLYIPTVPNIQFKSKAWIDSFGRTFSKTSGSVINIVTIMHPYYCLLLQSSFTLIISSTWLFIALAVGKKHGETVEKGEVIGESK